MRGYYSTLYGGFRVEYSTMDAESEFNSDFAWIYGLPSIVDVRRYFHSHATREIRFENGARAIVGVVDPATASIAIRNWRDNQVLARLISENGYGTQRALELSRAFRFLERIGSL